MEVGVSKIDEQHKELIARINAVTKMGTQSASKEETKKTIDMLSTYVIKHFTDEEQLHKQANYPKAQAHKEQHKAYLVEIKKMKDEFARNGPSPKFTLTMNNSVINWIVRHIKSSDADFGKFYNQR